MKFRILSKSSFVLAMVLFFAASCSKDDEKLTVQDTQDISEEAITDYYFQDIDDLSGIVVQGGGEETAGGRAANGRQNGTIVIQDDRMDCEGVVVTIDPDAASTIQLPKGIITVDFGAGCKDKYNVTRKGKLLITYHGRRFQNGSSIVITTDNYYINDVKLEGVRTLTNVSESTEEAPKFNITLTNGKATFSDGKVATREANINTSWIRKANPVNDELTITGQASGTTRAGRDYTVSVLESLVYKRFCPSAVSGVKKYVIDTNKEITLNYGDGNCDRSIAVTVNGVTRMISI